MLTPESIRARLQPLLEGSNIELVALKVQGGSGHPKFVITLDHRERGIQISEIEQWSRAFEDLFDMQDDIPRTYALDVSSPGVGHPLMHLWEFTKNVERTLEIELKPKAGEKRGEKLKGVLESVEGETLLLEGDQRIPLAEIQQAKVSLPW